MQGTGVALITPFTASGDIDETALVDLVREVEAGGVDFVVPAGTTGEAPLLSPAEQVEVIETVADTASVPVLAGTGQPGLHRTVTVTDRAAQVGADAALVVTPYYYAHDQATLADYYRDLADAAELPVYLYSIPSKTGMALDPATVAELAGHPTIAGLKDSSGDLERLHRTVNLTADAEFDLFVGHGGLFAHALEMGASGGILALANVAPERSSDIYERYTAGDAAAARQRNGELVELNRAITTRFGVAGLKAAMRIRGLPGGHVRSPHRPVGPEVETTLEELLMTAELRE